MIGRLVLEDGTVFTGDAFGAAGTHTGEVVFNTALTGYQEVFTDPSYCGQIVTLTFPLIGNTGVNPDDNECGRTFLSGVVVRELAPRPSNFRSTMSLADFLAERGVIGLTGIDTRALTRRIRTQGAMRGVLTTEIHDELALVRMAREAPSLEGANLVGDVTTKDIASWTEGLHELSNAAPTAEKQRCHILAVDCGIKQNILRHLAAAAARVTVAPAGITPEQVRELKPDGIVLGNGPGDPAAVEETIATVRKLVGTLPIFGVCLGHQLIALSLGAKTYKLPFGHHGANLPVYNEPAGRVEITSQNHGFAVDRASVERIGGAVTHVNLNDASLEGFAVADRNVAAVQFHPEASPGPHDAAYLFARFADRVAAGRPIDAGLFA